MLRFIKKIIDEFKTYEQFKKDLDKYYPYSDNGSIKANDLFTRWDKMHEMEDKLFILKVRNFFRNWKYRIIRIINIYDHCWEIKMFLQKHIRGYADYEVWNLYDSFAEWLQPRIRKLQMNHYAGYPSVVEKFIPKYQFKFQEDYLNKDLKVQKIIKELQDEYMQEYGEMVWKHILKEIEINLEPEKTGEDYEEYAKRTDKGLNLFKEYYYNLWD